MTNGREGDGGELIQREWWSTKHVREPGMWKRVSGHVHHGWHVQGRDPERAEKLIQRDGDAGGAGPAARVRPDLCHAVYPQAE